MLSGLAKLPEDPLLGLIAKFRADPNPNKIDLGVGVYKDDAGRSPVMRAVKRAERTLLETEESKSYLGPLGVRGFNAGMTSLLLGGDADEGLLRRAVTIHTPGGTAALRVGAEVVARARPDARVWLGTPSWVNHEPVLEAAGLRIEAYPYLGASGVDFDFEGTLAALSRLGSGDVALLQMCCHNPTGASPTREQWDAVAQIAQERGFLPFVDAAYQGLGEGLDEDAHLVRRLAAQVQEMVIASSCSKNFGLYRERTGALTFVARDAGAVEALGSTIADVARGMYSMPPSHGAAVADIILGSPELSGMWRAELEEMRARLRGLRKAAAAALRTGGAGRDFGFLEQQSGLFSHLGLTAEQVRELRERFAIYAAESSRINIAGLTAANVEYFAASLAAVAG